MRKTRVDPNGVELPDAGGLSGVKRLQMQQRGTPQTASRSKVAPKAATTAPVGYETAKPFNQPAQRLTALANPNFPRRRGQGLR